jgi:hypothetical protein
MENLLQEPSDINVSVPSDGCNITHQRWSNEIFNVKELPPNNHAAQTVDLVRKGILPGMPELERNPSRHQFDDTSDALDEIKVLDSLKQRGQSLKPEDLRKVLESANSRWKVSPDEPVDGTDERKEYLKTLDRLFQRLEFKTQFDFLSKMSRSPDDSSFMEQSLELLFARTAYDVGFDHKSLKQAGPQTAEYGKAIIDIWSQLPEAKQQRILAAMASRRGLL